MSKGRVLVVEDNIDNLDLVRFLLEQAEYEVISAFDGRDGLEKAESAKPDVMLLDMSMPEIDGWTVARQLKSNPATANIGIIALTAHTLPGDRKKALDAGCDGYISKPLDVPNFAKQVAAFIHKQKASRSTGTLTS